jgi:hypothetical protein
MEERTVGPRPWSDNGTTVVVAVSSPLPLPKTSRSATMTGLTELPSSDRTKNSQFENS